MNKFQNISTQEKQTLLEQLLRKEAALEKSSYPLSYGQRALWFLYQSATDSPAYNVAAVVRILSEVDVQILRDVFQTLLMRHSSLRSTFSQSVGQCKQIIYGYQCVDFEEIDVSGDDEVTFNKRVEKAYRRPFNLEKGPLFRVNLFTRSKDDHVLLISMHHILTDGWSLWMFLSEWLELYEAKIKATVPVLSPMQWQYQDFVRWQKDLLDSEEGERLWAYWQDQLTGELPLLNLPSDRPRPAVRSFDGASEYFTLPESLTRALKALSQTMGVTLYTVLVASFQVLLHRYTGQEDILVGSPTAGRSRPEFENIFGYFVNPIVLRAQLVGEQSFSSFLKQVNRTVLNGLDHQDYPFPLLVERLQPVRDASRSPIFQVVFSLQQSQKDDRLSTLVTTDDKDYRVNVGGLCLAPFTMAQQEGQFDITLEMIETEDSLSGVFQYSSDLFDKETIERMVGHFKHLLTGIVAGPDTQISQLPLLTEAEHHSFLTKWDDASASEQTTLSLHELFEIQAKKHPENVAVIFEDEAICYRELNIRANQLAHKLRELGVNSETLVGLFVERSVDIVVGILAILKAGGVYVPMDPDYPQDRLEFMAEDADLQVLLCHSATKDKIPKCVAQIIDMDSESVDLAQESTENLSHIAGPDDLAYIIYTSGSTGTPKGVCVEHRNVVRLFYATENVYQFDSDDVWTLFHSYGFDFSVWEIWGALIYGGTLIVVPYMTTRTPALFYNLLKEKKVTVLNQTPSAFYQLIQHEEIIKADTKDLSALRWVIFGGEALKPAKLKSWFDLHTDRYPTLVNMYGITETTVHVTMHIIRAEDTLCNTNNIGIPISDLQTFIMDEQQQLCPIGIAGELFVGGMGVTRGYLNRSELTAERYIPNPFSNNPDARLYRTGDLCRWLPDQNIEYLGRIDTQVKIRGFRIECGEVEKHLLEYSCIEQVVVDVRGEEIEQQLVAWVVVSDTEIQNISSLRNELRIFLRSRLPHWMVPARFVFVDELPLTPSGKVDRRSLPEPSSDDIGLMTTYIAPESDVEIKMAKIWSGVLGVDEVGLHDDFFDLGGHSLLAISLMAEIETQFGVQLPLSALFQGATIAELCSQITIRMDVSADTTDPWRPLVAIQERGEKTPIFCLPGAGGNVLYFQELASALGSEQPFYGLQAVGLDGESEPDTRTEDMARRYVQEIRTVQPHGPYYLGGHCIGSWVALEMAKQLLLQGESVARLIVFDSTVPLSQPIGYGWSEQEWVSNVTEIIGYWLGLELELSEDDLGTLNADSQLDYLHGLLAQQGFPVSRKQVVALVRVFKANCQMGYIPQDIPPMPITLLKARDPYSAGRSGEELKALSKPFRAEPTWGWGKYASGEINIQTVPGDHNNMLTSPNVQVLAAVLQIDLP